MGKVDERINEAIKKEKFTEFEILGFKSDYELALIFGAALGYKLAVEDLQNLLKEGGDTNG